MRNYASCRTAGTGWTHCCPIQDRNSATHRRTLCGFLPVRGPGERDRAVRLLMVSFLALEASKWSGHKTSGTNAMLDYLSRSGRQADHQGEHRQVRDVRWCDLFTWAAILPIRGRQDRKVSQRGATSDFSGARRTRYFRALCERLVDFPSCSCAARDSAVHPRTVQRRNEPSRLRDRIRLLSAYPA